MLFAPRQVDWADAAGNDDHRPSKARLGAQAIDDDLQGSFISAYAVMFWEGVEMGRWCTHQITLRRCEDLTVLDATSK